MQTHTMFYEADVTEYTPGDKIQLVPKNDKFIKPVSSYGNAHLRGILALTSVDSNTATSAVQAMIHFKNSNDIRETMFHANPSWLRKKVGEPPADAISCNPNAYNLNTSGWMEGNGRILPELSTNDIYAEIPQKPTLNLDGGHLIITVLVYIEYDGVPDGFSVDESPDKCTVAYEVLPEALYRQNIAPGNWVNIYGDDPGFIPGAAYVFKAFDIDYNSYPVDMLVRVRGLSTQRGLELIIPAGMFVSGQSTSQFIPAIVPGFTKQNFYVDVYAKIAKNSATYYTLSEVVAEFLTNSNSVRV